MFWFQALRGLHTFGDAKHGMEKMITFHDHGKNKAMIIS